MNLTQHFTMEELTRSAKAQALGIDNTPQQELVPRLIRTAELLERIRTTLGVPVTVTSGYRCDELNRAVGSNGSSDHPRGRAADFVAPDFGPPYKIAKTLAPLIDALGIGQLILESVHGKQWVHVSTSATEKACNRVLTITSAGTELGIQEVA